MINNNGMVILAFFGGPVQSPEALPGCFCSVRFLPFAGLLYHITSMVKYGAPQKEIVQGEAWTLGHLPIIVLAAALGWWDLVSSSP